MKRNHTVCAAAAAILALSAVLCSPAAADMWTYELKIFQINDAPASNPAGLRYTVVVNDTDAAGTPLSGQVRFTISNDSDVGTTSDITAIYFDDGLLGIASVSPATTTVRFRPDSVNKVNPGELPAGKNGDLLNPKFTTTLYPDGSGKKFSADADNPGPKYGLGYSEYVDITFNIGNSVAEVITRMDTSALRVGVHIQDLPGGKSGSAVSVIPAPAAVVLGLIGLGALGVWRRRYC